jgi:hypothetical protein
MLLEESLVDRTRSEAPVEEHLITRLSHLLLLPGGTSGVPAEPDELDRA